MLLEVREIILFFFIVVAEHPDLPDVKFTSVHFHCVYYKTEDSGASPKSHESFVSIIIIGMKSIVIKWVLLSPLLPVTILQSVSGTLS